MEHTPQDNMENKVLEQVGAEEDVQMPIDAAAGQRPEGSSKHWIFLDVSKIIAVILIVLMHVTAGAWGEAALGSFEWHVLNVFNCLSRIGMPLLFMQVGAAFLSRREQSIKNLYTGYIIKIVVAFFFWAAFYMFTYYLWDAPNGFGDFNIGDFILGIFTGAPHSQWFILLAISLYMLIPILRMVASDMKICKYFLILWAVFSIALPSVYKIPSLFPGMSESLSEGITHAADLASRLTPTMVLQFPGYMLLGYYLHKTEFTKKGVLWAVLVGLVGFAYTIFMTANDSMKAGVSTESFFGNFSINICLMAIGVTVGVKYLVQKIWFGPRTYNAIRFLSDVSFGIFLIHDFVRMGLVHLGITALSFTPILSVPILVIVVFVITGGIAYWLKNIPKVGPYIVGG